jgi:hypothetical protein
MGKLECTLKQFKDGCYALHVASRMAAWHLCLDGEYRQIEGSIMGKECIY